MLRNNQLLIIAPALLALIVSFDVVAIGYILSRLLPLANIRGWLANEYWEIAKSAMLIVSVYSVIAFLGSVALLASGSVPAGPVANPVGNLVYYTEGYLCNVDVIVSSSMRELTAFFIAEGAIKGIIIKYGPPLPLGYIPGLEELPVLTTGVQINLFSNFLIESNFVYHSQMTSIYNDVLVFLMFPLKVFNESEILLLPLLVTIALSMLIPAGILMRAFPFTRNAGGTLIGIGIGIAIVWPSTLLIINAPISSYFYNVAFPAQLNPAGVHAAQLCTSTLPLHGVLSWPCVWIINAFNYWSVPQYVHAYYIAFTTINSIYPSLNAVMDISLYSVLQLYILLIIDILVAYTLTDNIARMLGGTIRLRLGGKLKLV